MKKIILSVILMSSMVSNAGILTNVNKILKDKKIIALTENEKGYLFDSVKTDPIGYEIRLSSNDPFASAVSFRCLTVVLDDASTSGGSSRPLKMTFDKFVDCN